MNRQEWNGTAGRVMCVLMVLGMVLLCENRTAFGQGPEAGNITLRTVTPKQYEAEIQKHKGKVVFVDFWATWCVNCLRDFHHSVEWQKKYAKNGLVVISVSMDEPDEDTKKAAIEILKKQKAAIINLHSSLGSEEEAMKAFGIAGGAIPHYRIYDKTGKLVKSFGGDPESPTDPTDIEAALKQTLGI
jgi:thiol-disulfide isomerase/thioredoxin